MNKIKSHGYTALFFPYPILPHCLLYKLNEAIASWRVCWSGIPKAYLSVLLVRVWLMGGNWPLLASGSSWGKWKEMLHDQHFPKRSLRQQQHTQEVDELPTFLSSSFPILTSPEFQEIPPYNLFQTSVYVKCSEWFRGTQEHHQSKVLSL